MDEPEQDKRQRSSSGKLITVLAVAVIVFIGIFWFAIRPNMERSNCNKTALNEARADGAEFYTNAQILSAKNVVFQNYNQFYLTCLSQYSL
jgi:type II secretory pathway component PulM